ncbi:chaperone NapD [Roseibium suaedae]|uniref:Chaperone NapD n=1 Tax=Roseibium suaedae TaxID=735517 RepID=A0A1M7KAD5_9HYPH|nr:chaperone NapD [Roseibium suaedae]SHM62226.1 periplasmic nitrate reductase chaperone NapD [Roseibium suaedae]
MSETVHIASLLVQAHPQDRAAIEAGILGLGCGAEVAHSDEQGRLIVTLETASEAEIVDALTNIQLLTGVVSASLVYHQADSGQASLTAEH